MIAGVVRRAWWWLADYAYALRWQLRGIVDHADPSVYAKGAGPAIVLLPGVYENWRFLQPLAVALHGRGYAVHVIDALGRNRWPVEVGVGHVADYLRRHRLDDVLLVAHSKGGLIGKTLMADADLGCRIRGMVAVATPFGGSVYGRLMPTRSLRAFSPTDPGILALSRIVDVNRRIVSVYGVFDPHIPGGSELPGARNVRLATGGHFRVLAHPRIVAEVERMADEADAA